jgi:hypothetical protein
MYFFTIPTGDLTLISSILALATQKGTAAGVLAALSVILQTLNQNCDYGTKGAILFKIDVLLLSDCYCNHHIS